MIAARRAGAEVHFIAMLGKDPFGQMALDLYSDEGVNTDFVFQTEEKDTGAADIMVDDVTGDNAIIVVPGAADLLSPEDVEKAEAGHSEFQSLYDQSRSTCGNHEKGTGTGP